jgi:hypothetical protein
MKSVLVIGGGPAGLVAAKTLLQHGGGKHFKVTVFEAAERVGGMWRAQKDEEGEKCSPHMRTNLSRFTVSFSDLSWQSVTLENGDKENAKPTATTPPPMFPEAWQVGRYLQEYADKFIPNGTIFCNRELTKAGIIESASLSASRKWSVSSFDKASQTEHKDEFDHLIIASGFFGKPYHTSHNWTKDDTPTSANTQHSAKFRDVSSLNTRSGNIVIIGGGISGSEAAATAAFQLSNAKHAPGKKPGWANNKIVHIVNRPFYILPRYLPQEPYNPAKQDFHLAPHFLPLDLTLYNLSRRGEGAISASNGKVPPEKAKKGHDFIRSCIGGDQRDLGSAELVYKQEHIHYPSYTGISDMYSEFVRSGLIVTKQGYASTIAQQEVAVMPKAPWATNAEDVSYTVCLLLPITSIDDLQNNNPYKIEDVVAVIEATGYDVNLSYLSDEVKTDLQFDPDCSRLPLILGKGSVFNAGSRFKEELAFVGFYEGPYWGVMEAQSHLIAEAWAGVIPSDSTLYSPTEQLSLRKSILTRDLDVPQFWMSDYVGLVEEISRLGGISRTDSGFAGQAGPIFPARYAGTACDISESQKVLSEVANLLKDSNQGRFAAAATFRGMQGSWTLERKIDSRHSAMPGGTFKGTAHFHPRVPTDTTYSAEYLYMEEGILKMDNGLTFPATRRYIYRYNEATDSITAWFTSEKDNESVGKFFNKWEFEKPSDEEHGWIAKGSHWCSPDTYKNSCEFRFRGASLETFGITYVATGPSKDYTHESWYRRAAPRVELGLRAEGLSV